MEILLRGGPGDAHTYTVESGDRPVCVEWLSASTVTVYEHSGRHGLAHVYAPARLIDRLAPPRAPRRGRRRS